MLTFRNPQLTDPLVTLLALSCRRLTHLDLDNCPRLTDLILPHLIRLDRVELHDCRGISKEGCMMLRKAGVEVGCFWQEEVARDERGGQEQPRTSRRGRRGSCVIL